LRRIDTFPGNKVIHTGYNKGDPVEFWESDLLNFIDKINWNNIFAGDCSVRGSIDKYPVANVNRKQYRANIISFIIFNGNVPEGQWVCHSCDNPGCINPNHLWLGTPSDNTVDAFNKGRRYNEFGENSPNASIPDSLVIEIRDRHGSGERIVDIAGDLSMLEKTVGNIARFNKRNFI